MLSVQIQARVGSFELRPSFDAGSELVVLFGPSGSGKSLTLASVAGLLRPDSGRIVLPGGVVAFDSEANVDLPPQRRGLGYVVQDLALFPHMTAAENIAFPLARQSKSARKARVAQLLELLDLEAFGDRRPAQLSGGQQQRIALARALAAEPSLLLLDEPFSSLDTPLRTTMRREVAALRRRLDVTALFVTHDLNEAYAIADRIVVIDAGAVLQTGTREDIFRRPATLRVAELTEARNIIAGEIVAYAEGVAVVRTPWFTTRIPDADAPIRGPVHLSIRPEHVLLLREGRDARGSGDVVLETEIIDEAATAHTHRLFMRTTDSDIEPLVVEADVPAHPYDVMGVAGRREWRIVLEPERMALIPDAR